MIQTEDQNEMESPDDMKLDILDTEEEEITEKKLSFKKKYSFGNSFAAVAKTELIKILDQVCEENGITYFAISSLMCSAVYFHDFYPGEEGREWELALLREDYERLLTVLREYPFPKDVRFSEYSNSTNEIPKEVVYLEKVAEFEGNNVTCTHIFHIGLIPFDTIPENEKDKNEFLSMVNRQMALYKDVNRYRSFGSAKVRLRKYLVKHYEFSKCNLKEEFSKLNQIASQYKEKTEDVFYKGITFTKTAAITSEQLFPLQRLPFRDIMLPCPNDLSVWYDSFASFTRKLAGERYQQLSILADVCCTLDLDYTVCGRAMQNLEANDITTCDSDTVYAALAKEDYEIFQTKAAEVINQDYYIKKADDVYLGLYSRNMNDMGGKYKNYKPPVEAAFLVIIPAETLKKDDVRVALEKVIEYRKKSVQDEIRKAISYYDTKNELSEKEATFTDSAEEITERDFTSPVMDDDSSEIDNQVVFKNEVIYAQEIVCKVKTELLKLVDTICKENEITYFAIANLLTSCVHYQDFLPDEASREWDLGILRKDYQRLLTVLKEYEFPVNTQFNTKYKQGKKTFKKEVVYLEKVFQCEDGDNSFTDIMHIRLLPFDTLPSNIDVRTSLIEEVEKEAQKYRNLKKYSAFDTANTDLVDYLVNHYKYSRNSSTDQFDKVHEIAASFNDDTEDIYYGRIAFGRTKIIAHDQLFPLQYLPFRDITIPCPNDVTVWTPIFNEELDYQVKSIQKADLSLLKSFDEICRKMGIGYFVCGGTMLGYMRHGGFIPWDDDVDVAMLREDYDRFIAEASQYFDERFFLQTRQSDPSIPYLFSKLRVNNTEYVTAYNEFRPFHKGICLDIFPFDYLPNDLEEREQFIQRVLDLSAKHNEVCNGQTYVPDDMIAPRNKREKEYVKRQQKKREQYFAVSLADTQAAYIKEATKYNAVAKERGLTTVASFVPSYTYIDLEDLLPYKDGDFNGITVMVPKRPDIFLEMQYGDYMQLPPKHKQIAHKLIRWSVGQDQSGNESNKGE